LAKADVRDELKYISIPTLIIAGIQDPITTVEDAKLMLLNIPNAELVEINASHISNIEAKMTLIS
jgi:3-oxoadipate enol-lactonase